MSITAVSPLLLQRYELKYLIPMAMVDEISRVIEGHCEMDYYSHISPDNFYVINSLYFDTPNFQFLMRKSTGLDKTLSLRVRAYGADPKPPYYSEIKVKANDFSNKLRAKIDAEDWAEVIQTSVIPDRIQGASRDYLEKFLYLVNTHGAQPKILTQYRRKAYLSQIDGYARVTFDRDLRYRFEEGYCLTPHEDQMCNYDNEEIYPHPEENVILELKCEKRIPLWMIQLIKRFDLTRRGFSKYGSAIRVTMSPELAPSDFQPAFSSTSQLWSPL